MTENELSNLIIGAAIEVHRILGPGLLEGAYEEALCCELELRKIPYRRQLRIPIVYKGRHLEGHYKLDVLVDNLVIVECKSCVEDHPVHRAQCLTHLRLTEKRLGLVINFGQTKLKDGIHRAVNGLLEQEP